jgi:hypothetical protein
MIKVITRAAFRCGDMLASPWAILLLALVSLSALPQTIGATIQHGDITVLVGWFSQNFVQLVSLAVLAFIADRQGREAQAHADDMYDWLRDIHSSLHILHGKADALHEKVDGISDDEAAS